MSHATCPTCAFEPSTPSRFCPRCGAEFAAAPVGGESTWALDPRTFIRRISKTEFEGNLGRLAVKVPRGSVGVVVVDGKVEELLAPGLQVAVGLADRLSSLFNNRTARTDVYLVDVRPVPVIVTTEVAEPATTRTVRLQATVELTAPAGNKETFARLIEQLAGDKDRVEAVALHDEARPLVTAALQALRTGADGRLELSTVEEQLRATFMDRFTARFGLDVAIRLAITKAVLSVDVSVGRAPAPATKPCVSCGVVLQSGKKFCQACGTEQPVSTQPATGCGACGQLVPSGKKFCTACGTPYQPVARADEPIFTRDGQQMELDVVLRVETASVSLPTERVEGLVASLVRQRLGLVDAAELTTPEGIVRVQESLMREARPAVAALGLQLVDLALLDVRSKNGEWLLGARAELERAKQEALIGREWIDLDKDNIDLQALTLDLALRRRKVELTHQFGLDLSVLEDREARQNLLDREADLDVTDAQRDTRRALALDDAGRTLSRHRDAEDHSDALSGIARGSEVDNARFGAESQLEDRKRDRDRSNQLVEAGHEMELERRTALHDADLARQAMQLGSDQTRQSAQDQSFTSRLSSDDRTYAERQRLDLENTQADRTLERELTTEETRQKLQLEKMAAMRALDEQVARYDAEIAAASEKRAAELELAKRDQLRGLTTEQMLAMQAETGGEQVAAMFKAQAEAQARTAEAQAAALANQTLSDAQRRLLEEAREREAALMQQNQAQMMAMFQTALQTQAQTAAAGFGAQQGNQQAAVTAYQQAATQAQSMSERSMGAMSNVAAAASRAPAAPATRPCPTCTVPQPLDGSAFCADCGARFELSAAS